MEILKSEWEVIHYDGKNCEKSSVPVFCSVPSLLKLRIKTKSPSAGIKQ